MAKVTVREPLWAAILLERWSRLPAVDPGRLRRDVDAFLDPTISVRKPASSGPLQRGGK